MQVRASAKEEDTKENVDTIDGLSSASPTASLHSVDSMIRSWNISSVRGDKERKLIVQQLKKLQISEPVITLNIGGCSVHCVSPVHIFAVYATVCITAFAHIERDEIFDLNQYIITR